MTLKQAWEQLPGKLIGGTWIYKLLTFAVYISKLFPYYRRESNQDRARE